MLAKFSASLATHKSENRRGSLKTSVHIVGQPVCETAFRMLTGISSWSLTRARAGAQDGHASSPSNAELGSRQMFKKNASRQNPDLDARQWLDHYAAAHAEQSPISLQLELPAGRKFFYYMAYAEDRSSQGRPAAALSTFLEAWRCELPNVTVCNAAVPPGFDPQQTTKKLDGPPCGPAVSVPSEYTPVASESCAVACEH